MTALPPGFVWLTDEQLGLTRGGGGMRAPRTSAPHMSAPHMSASHAVRFTPTTSPAQAPQQAPSSRENSGSPERQAQAPSPPQAAPQAPPSSPPAQPSSPPAHPQASPDSPHRLSGSDLPPGFQWLGSSGQLGFTVTLPQEILAAKTALALWNTTHLAIQNYGPADITSQDWSVRDGELLFSFSQWYNKSNPNLSPLPEQDPGKNPFQTTLTDAHYHALTGLTSAKPVSGGGGWAQPSPPACPAGQWYNPLTGKCESVTLPGGGALPGGGLVIPPCVQDCMTKYAVGSAELAACLLKCAPAGFQPPTIPLPADQPGAAATACLASCNAKYGFGAATLDATKLATCLTECGGQKPAGGATPAGGGAPAGGAAAPTTSSTSGMLVMGGLVIGAGVLLWLATRGGGGGAAAPKMLEENPRGGRGYTKRQVEEMFRADVMPVVIERYGSGDLPALREAWNDYTDSLMKDGLITRRQHETWTHPKYDENPYVSNTALYVGGGLGLLGAVALIRAL